MNYTDLKLTEDRDIMIDSTGDIATVSGQENIEQQFANAIFRAWDNTDIPRVNPDAKENFRVQLKREFAILEYEVTSTIEIKIEDQTMTVTIESEALRDPYSKTVSP